LTPAWRKVLFNQKQKLTTVFNRGPANMDTFVMLLMLLVVLIYHAEQSRYFKEMNAKIDHLDELFNRKNEPVRRDLRLVERNKQYRSR
jgi:hypothetical protein